MTTRLVAPLGLIAAFAAGCSSAPPAKPEPVAATVTVTLANGQPAKDLVVNCFPTSANQLQGGGKTDATGKLTTKLTPGKYTFAVEGSANALKAVPQKYHQNNAAHGFEIAPGGATVALKLDN